jgi:hypothetical protein
MLPLFYTLALLVALLGVLSERRPRAPAAPIPGDAGVALDRKRMVAFAALCGLLCLAFGLQTALTDRAALSQTPLPDWFLRSLPLAYFAMYPPISAHPDTGLIEWTQALALFESAILLAIYFLVRKRDCAQRNVVAIALGAGALLAAIALRSTTTNVDLYLYIAHALVWPQQYAPPARIFAGQDTWVSSLWGNPILPSAYGPLWNLLAHLAVAPAHSLAQQALAIRLVGLASIGVCVLCAFRLQMPAVARILFALNPAIYVSYLARAHNDLAGVTLVLAAAVLKKRTWLAVLLVAAAGTIKLPLLLCGLLVFSDRPTLKARAYPAFAAIVACLGASYAFGGADYFRALQTVYRTYDHAPSSLWQIMHLAVAGIALAGVAAALWRRRFLLGAEWSFAGLGQFALPWYLAWCLPYALLGAAGAVPFLVAWPTVDYLMSTEFARTPFFVIERSLVVAALAGAIGIQIVARRIKRLGALPAV